jgi:hypothetical protein
MAHIAESTHWYDLKGSPCYQVEAAKGGMRNTTLRDARKLNLVPSVTTILKVAAQPGLERWKQEQVLHAALTLPRIPGESERDLLRRIWEDSQAQGKAAAERGTAIHASLQGHYEGKPPPEDHWPHVKAAAVAIEELYGKQEWTAEASFAHARGFGGKVDLHSSVAVIDFKTKEFTAESLPKAWDEHAMQLAAYRMGLDLPEAQGCIAFVSVSEPGLAYLAPISKEDMDKGWECFAALLTFWQAKNGYKPEFKDQ